jgi:TerC family integral membrane protein
MTEQDAGRAGSQSAVTAQDDTGADVEQGDALGTDSTHLAKVVTAGGAAAVGITTLGTRDAIAQTLITVLAAVFFCLGVALTRGSDDAFQWTAAYVLEQSLSVDNLFVFSLIFDYFKTPLNAQPRVLRWGLIGATVLRLAFIAGGLALVENFKPVLLVFAAILIYSSYGLLTGDEDEEEDLSNNQVVSLAKSVLPSTDAYDEDRFFTNVDGRSLATPLLVALVCVELSDVLFAVDSIPAVFGVTTDPFIAFSSNAFALLGLRALYPVVSNLKDSFEFLEPAIAVVLGFIGSKQIGSFFGYEISTTDSLLVVFGVLGAGIAISLRRGQSGADGDPEQ